MKAFIVVFGIMFIAVILIILILLKHAYNRIESLERELGAFKSRVYGTLK